MVVKRESGKFFIHYSGLTSRKLKIGIKAELIKAVIFSIFGL
jgi:hypothetical protein